MSDLEINKAIAELVYPDDTIYQINGATYIRASDKTLLSGGASGFIDDFEIDYCNNWSDLMPLIVEHRIETEDLDTTWVAIGLGGEGYLLSATNTNLQRALVECVYKVMKDKERQCNK